jgi:hypothetical protein
MSLILHKRSNVPLKAPSVSDLTDGELSINTHDGRLFIKTTVDGVATVTSFSSDHYYTSNSATYTTQNGITVDLFGTEVKIGNSQDLRSTASPAFSGLSISGGATIAGMQFSSYGSIFNDQASNNQLFQTSTNSLASGIGLWTSGGVNNALYSSGGIAFMVGKTLRSVNYPTGGVTPLTISNTGIVNVLTTTASTSTSTGALVVSGGVGIGGALNVGNGLKVTNNAHSWEFNSSGDLIIPDGGTLSYSDGSSVFTGGTGGGGSGLTPTSIKTANYQSAINELVRCNSTNGSFIVALPFSPEDGSIVAVMDVYTTFANHTVMVVPYAGETIEKDDVGFELDVNNTYISFIYNSATLNWRVLETPYIHADSNSLMPTAIISADATAASFDLVRCDSTTIGFSIFFPLVPVDGTVIGVIDATNTFGTHPVLLIPSAGSTIEDQSDNYELSISGMFVSFIYISATSNWRILNSPTVSSGTGGTGGTSELPSQTGNSGKFLKTNGATLSWGSTSGSGSVVLTTSATLITPNLGTPASGSLLNCTGYLYSNLGGNVPTWNQNTTGTAAGLSQVLEASKGGTGASDLNGLVKGNGSSSAFTIAVPGTDYLQPNSSLETPTGGTLINCTGYTFANLANKPTTASGFGLTDVVLTSLVGAANGIAPLGSDSKISATYLPSYVDDALEYDSLAVLPTTGETGKIYVAKDTNKIYRWTGTVYVEISPTAGNADSATKLFTSRSISITGDGTWTVNFDGSANATGQFRLGNIVTAATASKVTFNAKGLITGSAALTVSDITDITTYYQPKSTSLAALSNIGITSSSNGTIVVTDGVASLDNSTYVVFGGNLGTPFSGDLSNCTGFPYAELSGTVPTWNQNTTGTAAGLSQTLIVGKGGTGVSTITGIIKGNGTSAFSEAVAGTDFQLPIGTISGMVKGNGINEITAAVAGTDYLAPPSGTTIQKANNSGALIDAVAGTDYQLPIGTIEGMVKGNGTNLITAAVAGTDYVAPGTATTFTAKQSFTGSNSVLAAVFSNIVEVATIATTGSTGSIDFNLADQSVIYNTGDATNNWTLNFRHSISTTLNASMAIGQSITLAYLATIGVTDYFNNVIKIDGTTMVPKWQSGTAPTSGSPNSVDIYTYTIIKTADATFTVFASATKFA